MTETFVVDPEAFPIVVTTCPRSFNDANADDYRDSYLAVLARREPMVSIVDIRAFDGFASAEERMRLSRVGRETVEARRGTVLAIVLIVTSALVRATVRALHYHAQPEQPVHFVESPEEALALALRILAEHDVARPDDARIALARDRMNGVAAHASA